MERIKNISIFTNTEHDPDFAYTKSVVKHLSGFCVNIYIDRKYEYWLGDTRQFVTFVSCSEEAFKLSDIVIVLGGDGSILGVCGKTATHDLPVLGINLGNLGFLTTLERDDIEKLSEVLRGNYTIDERMMMDVQITDSGITHTFHALNDIVISSGVCSKIAFIELKCNGSDVIRCMADGIIIATPTGSTAYSLSAGGPIIDPSTELLCVTPVCPHTLTSRPIVFAANSVLSVSGKTNAENPEIAVTADGHDSVRVSEKSVIVVKKSNLKAKLVRIGSSRFYDIISTKLYKK